MILLFTTNDLLTSLVKINMTTIFYFILVYFTYLEWSWWWFILSIIFTALSQGSRNPEVYYQYTGDECLDGDFVEYDDIDESKFI